MPHATALYDTDFYVWTQQQAALLRAGGVADLDRTHLAEVIESAGMNQRHALKSAFRVLLLYLLKWRYQSRRNQTSRSWYGTIAEHRDRIAELLSESPSLHCLVPAILASAYPHACRVASHETRLPLDTFPMVCPWTETQVLSDDFWPKANMP